MKVLLNNIFKNPLISGSIVIFLGSIVSSFVNFLFNLFMTRNLSVVDYGALASLISVTTLFGLIISACVPTVIKFSSDNLAQKNYGMVKEIYIKIFFLFSILGLSIFLFFTFFSKEIGAFFQIQQYYLLPIVGLMSLLSYLFLINTSIIQAQLSFGYLSFINFLTAIIRLLSGVIFVIGGYALTGAIWANLLSTAIPYLISFWPVRFIFNKYHMVEKANFQRILSYGIPASLCTISLTSFTMVDIILVKHFFNPHDAGLYSGVSLVGKVIFFFTAPISTVMFPLVIQKKANQEKHHTIFELALLLVFLSSFGLSIFYYVFPIFTIEFFLKNQEYLQIAYLLTFFALFATVYSLLSIVINYFLSIGKTNIYIPVMLGVGLQVLLISSFHRSFVEVLLASTAVTGLLLISLLLYYLKTREYER